MVGGARVCSQTCILTWAPLLVAVRLLPLTLSLFSLHGNGDNDFNYGVVKIEMVVKIETENAFGKSPCVFLLQE